MVRARVNSSTSRWADEHILVIGILPFAPQKDGTSGPSSWKPVKDLVRFCMAQGSGDDPKVEIIDYAADKFQPQAFVKLKKEENAKCVFERVAGNFWYGNVLHVWWLISPTQPGANRPAQLLRYSSRREYPEALEKHTQIRDEKLVHRGPVSYNSMSSGSWTPRNARSRRQSRNSRDLQTPSRPTSQHSTLQGHVWPGQSNNHFSYCQPVNSSVYVDPYMSNVPSEAALHQWSMSTSMNPQAVPGQENVMLNQLPLHQWVAVAPGMAPQSAYENPVPMNMPLSMSVSMGMAPVYPNALPYMVSPMVMQETYMPGYNTYIPPSSAEYSYPNQKPVQSVHSDGNITAAIASLSLSSGSGSVSIKDKESVSDESGTADESKRASEQTNLESADSAIVN